MSGHQPVCPTPSCSPTLGFTAQEMEIRGRALPLTAVHLRKKNGSIFLTGAADVKEVGLIVDICKDSLS